MAEIWIHTKTGNEYIKLRDGQVKMNGVWYKSVNYRAIDGDETYTREAEDFFAKFHQP